MVVLGGRAVSYERGTPCTTNSGRGVPQRQKKRRNKGEEKTSNAGLRKIQEKKPLEEGNVILGSIEKNIGMKKNNNNDKNIGGG